MTETSLSPDQIHDVLHRAQEIELHRRHELALTSEVSSVIAAAEEVGVSRDAILQAMQEHFDLLGEPPKVGELVFAKSANEKYYVAEILRIGDGATKLCFLNGGETTVSPKDIRPFSIIPGSRLVCNWPDWGWWSCTVLSFDAKHRRVRVSDNWGSEETFSIADVQLDMREINKGPRGGSFAAQWQTSLAIFAGGGLVGALLTWFLHRP